MSLFLILATWMVGSAKASVFPVLQGATGPHSFQISVLRPKNQELFYILRTREGKQIVPAAVIPATRTYSEDAVDQVQFENLEKDARFAFQIRSGAGDLLDERIARTLDPNRTDYTFALVSCSNWMRFWIADRIWPRLAKASPDILLLLGDNVYTALKGPVPPHQVWLEFAKTRKQLPIFRERLLIPSFATWDDHDVGENNTDSSNLALIEAQKVHAIFFPRKSIPGVFEQGPGVSGWISGFGWEIFLLDGRTFRFDSGRPGILGPTQMNWAVQRISKAQRPVWMMNGHQFFKGIEGKESLETHASGELRSLIEVLRSVPVPVVFGSGDIHFSEINRIEPDFLGYESFEITSSAIHSFRKPWTGLPKNPRRVVGIYDDNFVLVRSDYTGNTLNLEVESRGIEKGAFFQTRLGIKK